MDFTNYYYYYYYDDYDYYYYHYYVDVVVIVVDDLPMNRINLFGAEYRLSKIGIMIRENKYINDNNE